MSDARAELDRVSRVTDDLLASVSHELRTPLNVIVGWARVLRTRALSEADREHALDAIDRNARVETALVSDLLDEAKLTRGQMRLSLHPCDLHETIRRATRTLQPMLVARDLRLELTFDRQVAAVDADEARLEQVIWRLLSNAARFAPRGSTIRVDTARDRREVRVRVRDSGEGIDRAFLPRVFDAFRQAPSRVKRPGLGLGLSLVKHIVELHGGAVRATSGGRDAGATFTISVPVARRVSAAG